MNIELFFFSASLNHFPDNPPNFKGSPGALPLFNLTGQESDLDFPETMLCRYYLICLGLGAVQSLMRHYC